MYEQRDGRDLAQLAAIVRKNVTLEGTLTEKQEVISLLRQSFDAAQQSFTSCRIEDLEKTGDFFGERTTVRRVFLRLLSHAHEHMGQAVAYARFNGIRVPWPDPLKELDSMIADGRLPQAAAGTGRRSRRR